MSDLIEYQRCTVRQPRGSTLPGMLIVNLQGARRKLVVFYVPGRRRRVLRQVWALPAPMKHYIWYDGAKCIVHTRPQTLTQEARP